jgi:hypothetical protein
MNQPTPKVLRQPAQGWHNPGFHVNNHPTPERVASITERPDHAALLNTFRPHLAAKSAIPRP